MTGDAAVAGVIELGTTVLTFGIGAILGLLTFARVVQWALSNYRAATLTFLVSLMVGALRLPVIEVFDHTATWTPAVSVATFAAAGIGALAVLVLDRYTESLSY